MAGAPNRPRSGEDRGFGLVAVEIGDKVNHLLVEILEHFPRELGQLRFGVTHGRGGVAVHAAEVAVTVHQREIDGEILRQTHQRVIHGSVAVGVIFTQRVADDTGALAVRFVAV